MSEQYGFQRLSAPTAITQQQWPKDTAPLVSVCCITYNHKRFITDCLDGILAQRTTFPVEIVVHDDASNDGTREIIQRYAGDYPQLFRLILQSTNQWSQGIKPRTFVFPAARGEYIAICDGDDYWISDWKLQTQFDILRRYPESSICFHPAIEKDMATGKERIICNHFSNDQFVDLHDVVLGRGGYMPTASLFFRNSETALMANSFQTAPIGDFFIQVFQASRGHCYYLKDAFSVYRRSCPDSWTASQRAAPHKSRYARDMLQALDEFYPYIKCKPGSEAMHDVYLFYLKVASRLEESYFRRLTLYLVSVLRLNNLGRMRVLGLLVRGIAGGIVSKSVSGR